jgi:hypothetical protein
MQIVYAKCYFECVSDMCKRVDGNSMLLRQVDSLACTAMQSWMRLEGRGTHVLRDRCTLLCLSVFPSICFLFCLFPSVFFKLGRTAAVPRECCVKSSSVVGLTVAGAHQRTITPRWMFPLKNKIVFADVSKQLYTNKARLLKIHT